MPITREVLNVFLASPTDVLPERTIAQEVVSSLNKMVGRQFGLHIDLHMWEDIGPGYGDPQNRINPEVDSCDLFVGLLWEKWGNPTAKYSSGFEEEFERAINRRRDTGGPEIWLVFKTPRPEKLDEPGPQLSKVLEFRESVKAKREVHFAEVKSGDAWKSELQLWLLGHVLRSVPSAQPQPASSPPVPSSSEDASSLEAQTTTSPKPSEVPSQLIRLSDSVRAVVASGRLEFTRDEASLLNEFDVARLFLLSATWMARRYAADFLGTHQINLLYKHRDQLEATSAESFQLLRTLLHDTSDVIPGWYWFRGSFPNGIAEMLLFIAARDSDLGLRLRALRLLTSAHIPISSDLLPSLPISDETEAVSAEAFGYLGQMGDEAALLLIQEAVQNVEGSLDSATEARLRILIRNDPKRAFAEWVAGGRHFSSELTSAFGGIASVLPREDLVKAARNDDEEIRKLSVAELARRGDLPLELAEVLRADSSVEIRQLALQEIVNKRGEAELGKAREAAQATAKPGLWALAGRRELDLELLTLNYYRTLPTEKLLETVTWSSVDGAPAYRVLATERYESISKVIRSDLETGFERIKVGWLERLKSDVGVEFAEQSAQHWEEEGLNQFVRGQFARAALSGLTLHGEPSDVQIARKYLSDENLDAMLSAVKIVAKFGGAEDVQALLDISDRTYGELSDLAAATAIRLSPGQDALALEMVKASSSDRNRAGFDWLVDRDAPVIRDYFRGTLAHENEGSRAKGVYYFSRKLSETELKELLESYLGEATYYYSVVTWLDRLLYAPPELRAVFLRELERQARS